jgi:glycosyltransferase involved in cell wall biosynthesis
LHFTSDDESNQASHLGLSSPQWVIPLGVELPTTLNQYDCTHPKGPCTVFLFLSRIHPKKQLERLLAALALVQQRQPNANWELQIAGDGDPAYLAYLKKLIQQLGLTNRCRWLGFLTGTAKWQALQAADWFVLPSASENFGIAAVEALAAGTPPILSPDVAVAADIEAASAGMICSAEPQALAQILESVLGGPPPEMCAAARNLAARQYSGPAIATQLHQAYAEVLR